MSSVLFVGYSARYYRLSRPLLDLTQAKADGSYSKLLKQIVKTCALLIDDWALQTLNAAQRNDLMEIMDDRHGSTSRFHSILDGREHWAEHHGYRSEIVMKG